MEYQQNQNSKKISTGIVISPQINTMMVNNDGTILTQSYISISEYDKLKEEKRKLEIQVETLQNQLNASVEMRKELQGKIDVLNKQIDELKERLSKQDEEIQKIKKENNMLAQIKQEYNEIKIYQNVANNLMEIFNDLCDVFTENGTFNESGDTDLYHLKNHLYEFYSKEFSRY